MKKNIITIIIIFSFSSKICGQKYQNNRNFEVHGNLLNKDTGRIVLWYYDYENKFHNDTVNLVNGGFIFKGTVNGACEALLWTNTSNLNFDDHSVVRFLLVPNKIFIAFSDSIIIIKGSDAQKEKENWDFKKSDLLDYKASIKKNINFLNQALSSKMADSINEKIRASDLNYIRNNNNSYLSGYLLTNHNRKLSIDTLQLYYSLLSMNVKKSTIGKKLLAIIYPLTSDNNFRKFNPLYDENFDKNLNRINSIYDFSLINVNGEKIDLGIYKGKYLILDFWASWCVPCLANIPTQKQLIKEYKNEPIEFISISLDTDINKWKESIIKHDLEGMQLIAPKAFAELIAVYCKVLWVPHYIIIDKNGLFINGDAPQPLDPQFKILLDGILKK